MPDLLSWLSAAANRVRNDVDVNTLVFSINWTSSHAKITSIWILRLSPEIARKRIPPIIRFQVPYNCDTFQGVHKDFSPTSHRRSPPIKQTLCRATFCCTLCPTDPNSPTAGRQAESQAMRRLALLEVEPIGTGRRAPGGRENNGLPAGRSTPLRVDARPRSGMG